MGLSKDIYLMNMEGLTCPEWHPVNLTPGNKKRIRWGPNPFAKSWLMGKKVMLVVDESTKFKNPNSLRFQSLKAYLPFIPRRAILTGTPSPNTVEDLFSQCYITDNGRDLGQYITHFRNNYMMSDKSGFGYVAMPGAMGRIAAKIAPTTLQVEAGEAVPTIYNKIWIPLPPHAKELYNKLRVEFLATIKDKEVMAPNAGVLFNKLRQVAQGAIIYDSDTKSWEELFPDKVEALLSIMEELNGSPLFCLYQYHHDFHRINAALGYEVPRIGSGVSASKGAEFCRQFGMGTIPLLLGHPMSVAHGVDGLQNNCSDVCWFGGDPSWENFYQANLRIVRSGNSAEQVTIHQILTDCGVERAMLGMVEEKKSGEEELLNNLREYLSQE